MSLEEFRFDHFDIKCLEGERARTEILSFLNKRIETINMAFESYKQSQSEIELMILDADLHSLRTIITFLYVIDFMGVRVFKDIDEKIENIRGEIEV